MFDTLHDGNVILFGAKHYNNPQCLDTVEFLEDMNRFKYVKRLVKKYIDRGELRERLILNHLVIIYNIFQKDAATRILFWRLQGYESQLKPFLIFLSFLPEHVYGIGLEGRTINTVDYPLDNTIVAALRKFVHE
jgi:hypothetical protein